MTGAQHYRKAEELAEKARLPELTGHGYGSLEQGALIALAQVHATLALVSATAHPADRNGEYANVDFGASS